jgi:curli biogenesis system outer membrane secretion channel CsgG
MRSSFAPVLFRLTILCAGGLWLSGCATPDYPKTPVEAPATPAQQRQAQQAAMEAPPPIKGFKRKIAIARFSNETRYGRTFVRSDTGDPLGKQTSDMLSARLIESGSFLVFERPDLARIEKEQKISNLPKDELVGVDTLIVGSLTEFGRATTGQTGFFNSSTKLQKVHAKVEIRLVEPRTGHVFFAATGQGEAKTESGEVWGFGSQADYDASLNDKAIGAAVADVMNSLVVKLRERPWKTDILKVEGRRIYISGGTRQGLKPGDTLAVMREGEKVRSGQSGFAIALPSSQVATLRVVSSFGDNETNEGSITELVSGSLSGPTVGLYVAELKG